MLTTDLTDEKSLKRILIEIARGEEREDRQHDYFYPSSLGQCERRVILEHAGVPGKPMTDQDALFFWIGNVIHDAVQKAISLKLPGQVWNEVHVRDETYKVSGRLDTLRWERKDGVWRVYEYKSQRTDAFRFNLPKSDHILQVGIYCTFKIDCPVCVTYVDHDRVAALPDIECELCKGTSYVGPATAGKLAYIGKEDGRIETFDIVPDEELRAAVKQKLMRLQTLSEMYTANESLPDKLPKQQVVVKGVPQFYVRGSKKFGAKPGDPKVKDDYRVKNCPYLGSGKCCGDLTPADPPSGPLEGKDLEAYNLLKSQEGE